MHKIKKEVNPDVAIFKLPTFYAGLAIFFSALALIVTALIQKPENDLFNATALTIEIGFGIAITWTVFIYSKKWKKENDKVTSDIKKITEDLSNLTKDVQQIVMNESKIRKEIVYDLSYHLNSKLDLTIKTLNHSLNMYENYKNNKDDKSENWKRSMLESYKRTQHFIDFKINLLDLMKIYGVPISRMYWQLLGDLQITSGMYDDLDETNIHDFATFVKEGLDHAEKLKVVVEPLGTESPT